MMTLKAFVSHGFKKSPYFSLLIKIVLYTKIEIKEETAKLKANGIFSNN